LIIIWAGTLYRRADDVHLTRPATSVTSMIPHPGWMNSIHSSTEGVSGKIPSSVNYIFLGVCAAGWCWIRMARMSKCLIILYTWPVFFLSYTGRHRQKGERGRGNIPTKDDPQHH
jgi:hypothetical protein